MSVSAARPQLFCKHDGCIFSIPESMELKQRFTHETRHRGKTSFACEHCGYLAPDNSKLETHRQTHYKPTARETAAFLFSSVDCPKLNLLDVWKTQ
jgi:hypothetical protein